MKFLRIICLFFLPLLCTGCTKLLKTEDSKFTVTAQAVVIDNYDGYAGQGRKISQIFEKVPEKVLAVSGSVVDNLVFLGLEKQIAATAACTTDSTFPEAKEYSKFPSLTDNYKYPSKEAVLKFKPDMIVSWGSLFGESTLGSVSYWHEKEIHTYVLSNTVPVKSSGSRTLQNIIIDLRNLIKIFRLDSNASRKVDNLQYRLEVLKNKRLEFSNRGKIPNILTIQYVYGNEYLGRTSTDLTSDIIIQAGGLSLDESVGGKRSIEFLIEKNPDIIMIVDMPSRPGKAKIDALRHNPLLKNVKAVRHDNFFLIPYRAFYGGSVYSIEATEHLHSFIQQRFRG